MTPSRTVLAALAVLAAGAALAGPPPPPGPAGPPPPGPRPLPVELRAVAPRPLAYAVDATGSLEADERKVCAEVAGVLRTLSFEEGDRVEAGAALATIDPETYGLRARKAKAGHDRAAAQMKEAQNALDRRRKLREKNAGWVSEEEILQYEARLEEARAACEEALLSGELAEEDACRSRLTAPVAGRIERRHVVAGQFVQPGTPVASLVDPSALRLRLRLTALEAARLQEGQRLSFRIPSLPGAAFRAVLFHVAYQADPSSRTVECVARVEADGGKVGGLRPGHFAEIRIETSCKEAALAVPEAALVPTERGYVVYVAEGGTARRRQVSLGLHTAEGEVEILSGLSPGDRVVVRGAQLLKDGAAIAEAAVPASP